MFVAFSENTMRNARPNISEPPAEVFRTVEQVRAERRAANREALLRREQQSEARKALEAQRAIANEAIRQGNLALRRHMRVTSDMDKIIGRICRALKVTPAELMANRRAKEVVFARQAVMYWACRLTGLSTPQVGRIMGRDHSTVIHSRDKYREKRAAMGRNLRAVR